MRSRLLAFVLPLLAGVPGAAFAQANPVDAAALAAACGGELMPADLSKMSKAAIAARLICFTREAAARFNKTLPNQVDAKTLLERVSAEGTTLTYHYKVDVLVNELRPGAVETFKPTVKGKVCGAADMRSIISIGGAYRYLWSDRNGASIGELVVNSCP
jgi:hypothetical protein